MARFILRIPRDAGTDAVAAVPAGLRSDARVQLISEMPGMLLLDCDVSVADEWLTNMPGWKLQLDSTAKIPDPRPRLRPPN